MKRILSQYLILFAIAGALAYGATQTSGAMSIVMAVLAGLLAAVALWSTVVVSLAGLLVRKIKRLPQS